MFDDRFSELADHFEQQLGEAASLTITTAAGSSTAVAAIVTPEEIDEQQDEHGRTRRYKRTAIVQTANYAVPPADGTATYGGVAYSIDGVEDNSPTSYRLVLVRAAAAERTYEEFRR